MVKYTTLENYYLLATKQRANVDKAMQSFIVMLEKDPDSLPAVLGMATGFMIDKSQHKARNLLKVLALFHFFFYVHHFNFLKIHDSHLMTILYILLGFDSQRVAKMEQKASDGEDFEKANLLLAKFYVDKGKPELSQDLCKRCLATNKSCSQVKFSN